MIWPELFIGVVDKGDGDPRASGSVIHDLSFPEGDSFNSNTNADGIPPASFKHCSSASLEITRCRRLSNRQANGRRRRFYLRNACSHSECVFLFAGHILEDNEIAIDLSSAFGWTGSSATYSIFGDTIAFIHGSCTNAAYPTGFYHWVDDHVNVATDSGTNCDDIECSLCHAMTAVMGPTAISDRKFTPWSSRIKVLGLVFDTNSGTVAIPTSNIFKGQTSSSESLSRSQPLSYRVPLTFGALRYVATCVSTGIDPSSIAELETAWLDISANTPLPPPPSDPTPVPSATGSSVPISKASSGTATLI